MSAARTRLIINADDLGAGTQRDRGIFRAFREGIVTSTSLLANGPSFAEAAREARECTLPVGVHLNLSEGAALTGAIPELTDAEGNFPGKSGMRRFLSGSIAAAGIRRELRAQVEKILAAGLVPDHLDTHQHFCLFPAVSALVLETAIYFGIRALRRSLPAEPPADDPNGFLGEELALYRQLASAVENRQACDVRMPDGLWGMPFLDRLNKTVLTRLLANLPLGTWELMVHPGYADAADPFSGPQREAELTALISPAVREIIRERNIELIAFGDLPCTL
jgi:predicted glycoside hydrolase/deacetylase ChbG (UPF0249 family)